MKRSIALVSQNCQSVNKLHINYWAARKGSIKTNFRKEDAIDFGLDLPAGDRAKFSLIIPANTAIQKPMCLVSELSSNDELLNSLFNEKCSRESIDSNNTPRFKVGGRSIDLIRFSELEEVGYKKYTDYRAIEIDVSPSDVERYVRFRIKVKDKNPFSRIKSQFSSFLETILMRRRLIDFRVNSNRQFPPEFLRDETMVKIDAIHFFFIHHSDEFVERCSDSKNRERFLETSVWEGYAPDGLSDGSEDVWEALHSKKELADDDNSFNIFISSKFPSINFKYLLYTFALTILLGIGINFSSTLLNKYFGFEGYLNIVFERNSGRSGSEDGDAVATGHLREK
ncbi:MAG: hypothetical protein CMH95_02880 [Oceanospirillaceae bacterium]|nr:hypothetical protein [Oceanospirillaceae bacterium]